jgi:hypothetical protein
MQGSGNMPEPKMVGTNRTKKQEKAENEFTEHWMALIAEAEDLNITVGMLVFWHNPDALGAKTPFVATINPAVEEDDRALCSVLDHSVDMIEMIRMKHRQ